jgi:diketogulonate reductase-like aldo/keto reductase
MEETILLPGGDQIVTDQVLYNLVHRGIEWDLLPLCRERGIVIMAYSPIEHASDGRSARLTNRLLKRIAARYEAAPAQVALAWLLQQNVVAIPKASSLEHVRENRAALDLTLTDDDLKELDDEFPPPRRKLPLAMR